jgi:hypothetical protein
LLSNEIPGSKERDEFVITVRRTLG